MRLVIRATMISLISNTNTQLHKALDLRPQVLVSIVSLNPHEFRRLHNPLMPRIMLPRIRLGRLANMT